MAEEKIPLSYKGHPLRRKDNLIYYGSMADKYIIMLQVMETKKVDDLDVGAHGARGRPRTRPPIQHPAPAGEGKGQPVRRYGRGLRLAGTDAQQQMIAP